MDRRTALIAGLVVAALSLASLGVAWGKKKSSSSLAMELVSIDRAQRLIHVELHGFKRAPAGNLFSMTDDRGRHYIAQTVRCVAGDTATLPCALEIPDGYERHPLVSLELHVRGLHSRTIAVPADVVSAAWQAENAARSDGGMADLAPSPPRTP